MAKRKNEKKRNSKKRLLILLLLLVFTLTFGSIGTYAWFTSNRTVKVSDLQVYVNAVNGLEISADAVAWGTALTIDDLNSPASYESNKNQLPANITAVSTAGNLVSVGSDYFLDMYRGEVNPVCPENDPACTDSGYLLTTMKSQETACFGTGCSANQVFMAFDIFLKVNQSTAINLAGSEVVHTGAAGSVDRGVKNSSRVAFLVKGHKTMDEYYASDEAYKDVQALAGTANSELFIWEPNATSHTQPAVIAARDYYGLSISAGTSNPRLQYEGVAKEISTGIPLDETSNADSGAVCSGCFVEVGPNVSTKYKYLYTEGAVPEGEQFINLEAGVTKLRVYFWVEGQDVDAQNEATGTDMKLNIKISIP